MSRIIFSWTCDHCKKEYNGYISFGHPDNDFIWKWECQECGHENEMLIEAMPRYSPLCDFYDTPEGKAVSEKLDKILKEEFQSIDEIEVLKRLWGYADNKSIEAK